MEQSGASFILLPLARIGGLPITAIPTSEDAVDTLLRGCVAISQEISVAKKLLLNQFYTTIPTATKNDRRMLLNSKRLIFNNRKVDAFRIKQISPALGDDCNLWNKLLKQLDESEDSLRQLLKRSSQPTLERWFDSFLDAEFLKSVAIASPNTVKAIQNRSKFELLNDRRMLRSAYLYVTRAALKTSPFSGFTTIATPGEIAKGRTLCTISRQLAYQLFKTAANENIKHCHSSKFLLEFSPFTNTSTDGHDGLVLIPDFHFRNGIIYREESVLGSENINSLLKILGNQNRTFTVEELKKLLDAANPNIRLQRYIDSGIIRYCIPWRRGENPFPKIRQTIASETHTPTHKDLIWLESVEQDIKNSGSNDRMLFLERLGSLAGKCFSVDDIGQRPSGFLYEDREYSGVVNKLTDLSPVHEDLKVLSELCAPWIVRSNLYDLMVKRFCARYGKGGICTDVLGFLMAQSLVGDGDLEELQALTKDYNLNHPHKNRTKLLGGLSAAPKNIGAFIQLCGNTEESIANGDGLTVVNAFGNGNGAANARFHKLFGDHYREKLSNQIRSMWGIDRVYELQLWTEINTGQEMSTGVLPALQLPGEPITSDSICLSKLSLIHDKQSDTLYLSDNKGPIGLAYLGLTPQHLLSGYIRWLTLLSDPWTRLTPYSDHWSSHVKDMKTALKNEITYKPRVQFGRLVTRRATWFLPQPTFIKLLTGDLVDIMRAFYQLRIKFGIPREVFIHQILQPQGTTVNSRKPLYVDFTSEFSIIVLKNWLDARTKHIKLVEALPDMTMHHFRDENSLPRVREEYISMYWEKLD